jgi:osmotically-inducible protein OsmY
MVIDMSRMTRASDRSRALATAALAVCALAGCNPAVAIMGAGAVATTAAVQERPVDRKFSDVETESTINANLAGQSPEMFRRVGVEVIEGRVVLTGAVSTVDQRMSAEQAAWSAPGTRDVANELTIDGDPSFARYSQDLWITTQLSGRLLADEDIMSVNYNIETHRGVVHLIGIARSQAELDKVTGIAARVPGVKQVVSHVILADDPRRRAA